MNPRDPSRSPESCLQKFPRIGSYGFLSDCETGALVAANGSIEWMCLPRFDAPTVFGALLDRSAGAMRFSPDERVPVARRYEPGTNLIETTWATETGWLVVRDALLVNAVRTGDGRNRLEAERMLVRLAHCPEGNSEIELVCEARPDYGRGTIDWDLDAELGVATAVVDGIPLRLQADMDLELDDDGRIWGTRRLGRDENAFCALTWSDDARLPGHAGDAGKRIYDTAQAWRRWLERGRFPDHRWRGELQRSALTLKGLMYAPTGGMVAALTTSLPETPGGERNWDYRYTWIRDATFALWGLHVLGLDDEAKDFMGFVERVYRRRRRPADHVRDRRREGADRDRPSTTSTATSARGPCGSATPPTRSARTTSTARCSTRSTSTRERSAASATSSGTIACRQVEAAMEIWEQPDQGIWEARGDAEALPVIEADVLGGARPRHPAREGPRRSRAGRAAGRPRRIGSRTTSSTSGVTADGVFRQHYDTDELDASTLLIPLVRFLPSDDERVVKTVLAIADELTVMGLVLRYRVEQTDDGLHGVEGTFTICSFWLVSALAEIGEHDRAAASSASACS